MSLPYSSTTSGENAIRQIQRVVQAFGCTKFSTGEDFETGEIFVQFEHRGRFVTVKASAKGYAAAWLKENPWNSRRRCSEAEYRRRALDVGSVAVWSVLRDWIKGQITAIETGILSFEGAFLGQLMLDSGRTVLEELVTRGDLPALGSGS